MAEPVNTLRSLDTIDTLDTDYSVFERDQVLTEKDLNSVSSYFDVQDRLTRVELLGVGLVGGLRPALSGTSIKVGKGLGLTTDGDLLFLNAETVYDGVKPYDENAPFYGPFYTGSGSTQSMLTLWELLKPEDSDPLKNPLSVLPGNLNGYVVVIYMENYQQDHDLCTAADCDNMGITVTHTPRMLLVQQADVAKLAGSQPTLAQKALLLPRLAADRPAINGALTTTSALLTLFLNTCKNIHGKLIATLGELHKQVPVLTLDLFGGDPGPGWISRLIGIQTSFASNTNGVQYYYDFLKDVAETWNAMRDALLDSDGTLCPDLNAFPKHLLLGALGNPTASRTGFYPSPLIGDGSGHFDHARFLAGKLHALINTFALPATSPAPDIVVTPSRGELYGLEERAIPYYYDANSAFPLLVNWNWKKAKRGTSGEITAYWAAALGAGPTAQSPLTGQIGGYDFFRIEGLLGQDLDAVMDKLEAEIAAHNLPFSVRAVLLHNGIGPIKRKPKIRYNDLHRLHKLIRTDVDSEMQKAESFSVEFKNRIKSAAQNKQFDNETTKANKADQYYSDISAAIGEGRKTFASKTYTAFKADKQWSAQHEKMVKTAGSFKQEFGDVSRTDYTTPLDGAIVSNHRNWLDWIDVLIDDKDKKADERLLFGAYLKTHPGLEHSGGVARGGTFVVVYNDNAKVVADFALPYREAEPVEAEPEEPTMTYLPPPIIKDGLVMVKPIEWRFEELKPAIRSDWQKEITTQKDYINFFQKSLSELGGILGKFNATTVTNPGSFAGIDTGNAYIDVQLDRIKFETNQLAIQRELLGKGGLDENVAAKLNESINVSEQSLAALVKDTTSYVVDSGTQVAAGQKTEGVTQVLGKALVAIKGQETLKGIDNSLMEISAQAPEAQKGVITGIRNAGGLKFR
jgi:hypothetical protein